MDIRKEAADLAGRSLPGEWAQYSEILQPPRIAEYLATINWTPLARKPFGELWADSAREAGRISSVVLPSLEAGDFYARWTEAVTTLSTLVTDGIAALAEAVASVRADVLFVRVDQYSADSTIPLQQATRLLTNIQKMVRSAAAVTENPRSSGAGKISNHVKEFLSDDVRMGHTKRGSFIITVAARHDEIAINREWSQPDQLPSFTREVMETLSNSIVATKKHLAHDEEFRELEDAVSAGVTAPFVEALQELGAGDGLRQVDLSFNWSESLAVEAPVTPEISFTASEFVELKKVRERLTRDHVPVRDTVIGKVASLKLDEHASPEDGGRITLRGEVSGAKRVLHLDLDKDQYDLAIRAHAGRFPIVAIGTVKKDGKSWTMDEDLVLSEIEINPV